MHVHRVECRVAGHTHILIHLFTLRSRRRTRKLSPLHAMFVQSEKNIRRFSWKTKKR